MGLCYNNYVKMNSKTFENTTPEFVLKTVFGYDSFRPYQKEIIQEVLKGKDTLAVMPTGGGKSICYQIPALIFKGITIVVSPLISLMQDQVYSLETSGIHAAFLNSSLSFNEYKSTVNEIKAGNVKIVYVSPEGLATSRIRELFTSDDLLVSCITIDEAHCVSEWGHDFRPDYLEIKGFHQLFKDAVMLALTATATEQVRLDITKNLGMKNAKTFVSSFNRPNIFLEVQIKKNPLEQVVNCIKKHLGESGIIYCFSRRQVDELSSALDKMGYSVAPYHAGLDDNTRTKNQEMFIRDEIQIIVATVAFGMGINKPNVRFVINYDLPKSIEVYYQEIGRAGRDGLNSHALLLYSAGDVHKIRFFFEESADSKKSELLLQKMVNFATSRICRRKEILAYFGEKYINTNEEQKKCCCDICVNGEIPKKDVTVLAQKLLCCILRTGERFGSSYIIDVLLGSNNKRIIDNNHNLISTWGIGKELSKDDWFVLIDLLISADYLRKEGEYSILKVTSFGKSAVTGRETILLPFSKTVAFPKAKQETAVYKKHSGVKFIAERPLKDDSRGELIVESLKKWRKRKADDMNVPPYVIFGDKTIYDIAAKKPSSKAELLNCYGIGEAKADQFSKTILRIIEDC